MNVSSPPLVCARHAQLSAGIESGPPGWKLAPKRAGNTGWVHPQRLVSVITSFRDYGPLGLWRYVSVCGMGASKRPPADRELKLVRRLFCVPETRVEQHTSRFDPRVVFLEQRIYRNVWQDHPDRARLDGILAKLGIAREREPDDPAEPPACSACSGRAWRRDMGHDEDYHPVLLLVCAGCNSMREPFELEAGVA